MKTDKPAKVRIPPMIQRKSDTPAEPDTAKMPDGVEKTVGFCKQCTIGNVINYLLPVPIILFRITKTVAVYPSF